uniref:Centrosomal protein of 135 kDa n=1 Tax=Scophthalmus maximus TaxID=52904 RepID=A0A8D3D557_SCOMX
MNSNAERKFVNLRKRLDQLGYRQPLGIESLPLVEKLFSDLVHTTESLRNAKLSAGKTEKESRNLDALLEPYRTENARVVRENNEMHLELLKLKEEKDRVSTELKTHIRKLDHESSDLKFLNNQYVHKVRCLEKDSKAKAERIQQLQEKNMQAVVQTPGGKKRSIPFRRQRMQIDELTPPSSASSYPVSQPDDPYIADLLQLADKRFGFFYNSSSEPCLQGGRPHDVISLEAQHISNEKLISHLNLQIEYLQESNRTLEQKVEGLQQRKKDASSEVANLSLKNLELCEELTHIDDLAKRLEMDKERVLETADMELQETKQSEGDFEKDRLRDQLVELKGQNEKMEGLVNFLEEEKIRLQDKVENIMSADKELVLELETMRAQHGVCRRERSPSRLDAFVKSLEEERDYYRLEAERYKGVRRAGVIYHQIDAVILASHCQGGVVEAELLRVVKERDELKAALFDFEKHMEEIQNSVKALCTERDHFKSQFKQVSFDNHISLQMHMKHFLLLQEQMEQSLSDTQHRLSVKMNELHNAHQQIEKLEKRMGERGPLSQLQGALNSREREISSLRRQLDASQDELPGLRREKEITIRENRRLQDDLATMTRENQAVHMEMEEALHEKDELKLRVHTYISEVSRIEKLMATKEQENRDLLERFRMAHSEVEERKQKLMQAEGLNNSIRLELLSSDSDRRHLRDTVGHQEREIHQHTQALQAYEAQVSSLVRGMSRLEEELHKVQEEKAALLSDLASVRELCVKLDSGKELTARQLTSRSMDLERVTGELEDVRSEAELLKKQLASERLTVRNLETLLSTNRQKEFQTHLTASERESDLKILRDRLTLADSKTAEHAREVSQLCGKLSQLQTEMDVLKRQLTTERFERERAVQEMRRQGLSLSSLHSSSSLSASSGSHHISPERSILRSLDRSTDKSADKSADK